MLTWKNVISFSVNGNPKPDRRVEKTEAEWQELLTPEQFRITRKKGTEAPHSGALCSIHEAGKYNCVCCDTPLFDSTIKFESGTGWPSFFTAIDGALETSTDYKLIFPRTEVHCARCEGHLGHIFDDGPPPTGQRHCLNGLALTFKPAAA